MSKKVALVVIDLQEDFLPTHGSLAINEGRSIVPAINELITNKKYNWSAIIATQDWHPRDHTSFASQHNVDPFSELEFKHPKGEIDAKTNEVNTMKQYVWPDHCVQGTPGACIEASFLGVFNSIRPEVPKAIVKKGYLQDREYYSCFEDAWGIHHTEMEKLLRDNHITDVVFVGLAYDFCVLNSSLDCAKCGFNTFVLKNYSKSVYPDKEEETEKLYTERGVTIINDDSFVKLF
ncbi:PNC1 [[Candida] subhashii]|uniref:PNC1 n=1 Tax=[Candida] subhashii TaxID=561895 RepID=A0A8J5UYA9_9ASCO|nr:PNC1 [[Candida] subhashii]KAG7662929.1 PNC1 [[Candida] subhashii]